MMSPLARAGAVLAVLALSACTTTGPDDDDSSTEIPRCDTDADCSGGDWCIAGVCQDPRECRSDDECVDLHGIYFLCNQDFECETIGGRGSCATSNDCEAGHVCAVASGVCYDANTIEPCDRDLDCPPDPDTGHKRHCDSVNKFCALPPGCLSNIHCTAPNTVCDVAQKICVLVETDCTRCENDAGCGDGNTCDPFGHTCSNATSCRDGLYCSTGGRCVQCLTDDECGEGLFCNEATGLCQGEDFCNADDECPEGRVCDTGSHTCRLPPPPCDPDDLLGCSFGETCDPVEHVCVETPPEQCDPDAYESNNNAGNAFTLADGTTDVDGTICEGDADWYLVYLSYGERIILEIETEDFFDYVVLTLLAPDGTTELGRMYSDSTDSLAHTASIEGNYFLRVSYSFSIDPYTLSIDYEAGDPCEDAAEGTTTEGRNDTVATATALAGAGTTNDLALCFLDHDWYTLTVEPGYTVGVAASLDAGVSGDLKLWKDGTLLVSDVTGAPLEVFHRTLEGGVFNVEVVHDQTENEGTGPYDLTVTLEPPFACSPDSFDTAARNETPATASVLLGGGETEATMPELALCSDDVDYYVVTLGAAKRLSARIEFVPAQANLDLYLYHRDADGVVTEVDSSHRATDPAESVAFDSVGGGDYLVEVVSADLFPAPYSLALTVEDVFICTPDAYEPNNDSSEALEINAGVLTGTVCEVSNDDWYEIFLGVNDDIQVVLAFEHAEGDLDLHLVAPDGRTIDDSRSTNDEERVVGTADVEGFYQIHVDPYGGATSEKNNLYALTVSVDRDCVEDALESTGPSRQDTPIVVDFGEATTWTQTGLALCYDEDWYEVTIPACSRLVAEASFTHESGDIDVEVLETVSDRACARASADCEVGEMCAHAGVCATGDDSRTKYDVEAVSYPGGFRTDPVTVLVHVFLDGATATTYDLSLSVDAAESGCP